MLFVEGLAMLRQLIGQVQELLDLYGTHLPPPPPPTASPPYIFHHQPPTVLHPPPQRRSDRWCLLNLEDNPSEDECYNLVMRAGKFKMLEHEKGLPSKRARKDKTREKQPETSNPTEIMEPEIWQRFPEDLFETIIARLPVATFFRFRSVCQKWNSLLTSNSFSVQCGQVVQTQPWFYTRTHENVNTGAMYDPVSRKWHHPTAPAVPTKMILLPVASAGGLICFLDIGHRSFYVCNPLTQSFRELHARSVKVWSRVVVGMTVFHKSGNNTGYKIMWVRSDGEYEVYDSRTDKWMCPGGMPACIKLPLSLNFRSQPVTVDGCMYFLRSDPDGIVSYDMETGIWKQFTVPVPGPVQLSDHALAECDGRIMLVGLVSKNAATCVCIWELQKMSLLWKEVDRMPNVWCLEFYGKHIKMSCLGNKTLLMLSIRSKTMNRLVTYDVLRKEWDKVPNCVFPHSRKRQWIACGTSFHPCLTAKA